MDSDRTGAKLVARWKRPYTVLSLCLGAYFAVRFPQIVIGPLIPHILDEFQITRGDIGIALTGMWVGYALLQLPSGVFADRFGEYRVVLAALLVSAFAALALALTPSFLVFGLATIGIGIGAGAYYNPATALLTKEFDKIGGVIGIHRIGGQVAGVLAPIIASVILINFGWRPAIAIGAFFALVLFGLFLWKRTPTPSVHLDASVRDLFAPSGFVTILVRPHTRNTTFLMTLVEFVGLTMMAFLPIFLIEQHGYSSGLANLLLAVFFTVSAVAQPISGRVSDRIGRDSTVALLAIAGVLGYTTLIVGNTSFLVIPAVILAGSTLSTTPVLQARMMDGLDIKNQGTGFGLFRTVYLLLGATGTTVVGTTADIGGWSVAFGLLAALWGVIFLALLLIHISALRE